MTRTLLAILAVAMLVAAPWPAQPAEVPVWPSQQVAPVAAERTGAPQAVVRADGGLMLGTTSASRWKPADRGGAPLPAAVSMTEPRGYGSTQPVTEVTPTPAPTSGIGTALWTTSATWCAPTRTQCLRWGGHALLAALPTYTGKPYWVRVWFGERHVDVRVVSICGCGIDLTKYAFSKLADPSVGRIQVEVEGPISLPALPATDTEAVQ